MASKRVLLTTLTLRSCRAWVAPHATRRRHVALRAEDYIESTTNALVKRFKRCHRKKHRDAENVVLVEGRAFVAEVLARGDDVEAVLVADDVTLDASLFARAKRMARAPDFVLKAASTTDSPQGCVALVARPSLAFPAPAVHLVAQVVPLSPSPSSLPISTAGGACGAHGGAAAEDVRDDGDAILREGGVRRL